MEYQFNRNVVNKLVTLCDEYNIEYDVLVPELTDISLKERCTRANAIYSQDKSAVVISVHANAGGGTGFEVFTSVGETKSDAIAEVIIDEFAEAIPELRLRKDTRDGDKDKEAHFYILKHTNCPAILIECAFMDTLEPDCRMLLEDEDRFVEAIFNGILELSGAVKPTANKCSCCEGCKCCK
jgi:N-acetylmuramoyl-L-alanine amidase